MSAAGQHASGREVSDVLWLPTRPEIAIAVGKTHDAVCTGNIEKLRVRPGGIKRETERLRQVRRKFLIDLGMAVRIGITQHGNCIFRAFLVLRISHSDDSHGDSIAGIS